MKNNKFVALAVYAAIVVLFVYSTFAEVPVKDQNELATRAFTNPATFSFDNGCAEDNLDSQKFSEEVSSQQAVKFCQALESVVDQLNETHWSPELRAELISIWNVFKNENITVHPMKKDTPGNIAAMAEGFVPNSLKAKFSANLYLRPEKAGDDDFFLVSMHELRHIFDFYTVWKSQTGITQAELEKRGFRIMGRVARETPDNESFSRLPKLWEEDWNKLSNEQISSIVESRIEGYMSRSNFYKELMRDPERYYIGRNVEATRAKAEANNKVVANIKGGDGRLPYLVREKNSFQPVAQGINEISFKPVRTDSTEDPQAILRAAIENEKMLYYKMDNFVYDQSLNLKCWKKERVSESYDFKAQIARTANGDSLKQNVTSNLTGEGEKGSAKPGCVLNLNSIKSDATETFWSAPYLDEVPVRFDYFMDLNGVKVARYSVSKPSEAKLRELEKKYPFINPFRIFFGSIFVAVNDAQIVKFWGSSYPEADTTGQAKDGVLASYNATAIREKLTSGIWVTVSLNTVAVANNNGKQKPFSYTVNYSNYRQTTAEMEILDDNMAVETTEATSTTATLP